jgi:hypothetical protein
MSAADPMARLMVEDRARVHAALREAGIGIRDLQAPDARLAARYLLTAWLATATAAVAWRALDGAWALLLVPALGVIQHAMLDIVHVDHHAYLRTPRDPSGYVTRPDLTAGGIRRTLLFLLCGRLAWIATLLTVTPTLDGIRTLVEHRALPGSAAPFHTRSHHLNALLSGLAAPFFQYHWEHHLFPAVPHHRLAELHRLLVARDVPGARPPDGGFLRVLARVA